MNICPLNNISLCCLCSLFRPSRYEETGDFSSADENHARHATNRQLPDMSRYNHYIYCCVLFPLPNMQVDQ
jgi:hypothetical protein